MPFVISVRLPTVSPTVTVVLTGLPFTTLFTVDVPLVVVTAAVGTVSTLSRR
jgi:hypothetical protein